MNNPDNLIYKRASDAEYLTVSALIDECSIRVDDFQQAIRYCISKDSLIFWDEVMRRASNHRIIEMPRMQAPHLYDWIKANWYWFTDGWSKREMYQLQCKLWLLDPSYKNR